MLPPKAKSRPSCRSCWTKPQLNFPLDPRSNQQNPDALYNASAFSVDVVIKFLRRGALVNAPDTKGWTALPLASRFNDGPVMQALIAAGADATLKNNDGQTADDLLREISGEGTRIESVLRRSAGVPLA